MGNTVFNETFNFKMIVDLETIRIIRNNIDML